MNIDEITTKDEKEMKANARLIETAKIMLDALKAAEEFGFYGQGGNAVYDKVCDAIEMAQQQQIE